MCTRILTQAIGLENSELFHYAPLEGLKHRGELALYRGGSGRFLYSETEPPQFFPSGASPRSEFAPQAGHSAAQIVKRTQ